MKKLMAILFTVMIMMAAAGAAADGNFLIVAPSGAPAMALKRSQI